MTSRDLSFRRITLSAKVRVERDWGQWGHLKSPCCCHPGEEEMVREDPVAKMRDTGKE